MILNRIRDIDQVIQDTWKQGRVNFALLDDGDYTELANYITKPPSEEAEKKMQELNPEDRKKLVKYSCSRNLIRPEPERKEFKRRTVQKMLTEGIKPTEGYYIVTDSIETGVNPYTGMSYIHYRERRNKSG